MCEAKMDPESPEESDKQNMIDIKSTARSANSESPSPPTGSVAAASPPQTVATATSTGAAAGMTPPIKHCPLTPQSQGTVGDDDDEDEDVHEQDADVSDQVEDEEDGHHNHHRHHAPARSRHHHIRHRNHHHHRTQEQPYNYGINKMEHDGDNVTSEDEDEISVGGSPSPSPTLVISPSDHHFHPDLTSNSINSKRNNRHLMQNPEEEYFKPLKKLRMLKVESPTSQNAVGVKSFSISDILSHKPSLKKTHTTKSSSNSSGSSNCSSRTIDIENVVANTHHHHQQQQQRIVRPWDPHQQSNKSNGRRNSSDSSPLDALFQMTSKTFEGLNGHHEGSEFGGQTNAHQAFNARQPPKKKRKSRTAFTNHQIFELEKRFLYQKYLSPADRDDIAHQLGLTNAQVITWFQNRRAKLKRDMEEMKKDAESLHMISAHKTFLESAHDLALLKKRAQSMDMSSAAAAAVAATAFHHISSPTSSSQSSHSPINLTSESPPSTH